MSRWTLHTDSAEAAIAAEWHARMVAAENEWLRERRWCDCAKFRDSGRSYGRRRACLACGRLTKQRAS